MTMIKGIAASNGIAIAKAYKLVMPDLTVEKTTVEDVEKEIKAYEDAMDQTAKAFLTLFQSILKIDLFMEYVHFYYVVSYNI